MPGPEPLVHGYDVQRDIVPHYGFAELLLLTLVGKPPSRAVGRAFEVALCWLAPVPVSAAPSHAAVLSALIGAPPPALCATAATGLGQQAAELVARHQPLFAWFDDPDRAPPPGFSATTDADRRATRELHRWLPADWCTRLVVLEPGPTTAALLVLYACGLRSSSPLITAIVCARLPSVMAEALAVEAGSFIDYPTTRAPVFHYDPSPLDSETR